MAKPSHALPTLPCLVCGSRRCDGFAPHDALDAGVPITHRSEKTLDLDDVAYGHPVAVAELAALRNVADVARRHYGSHADLADAIDRLDALR